jgi:hypothetical protein
MKNIHRTPPQTCLNCGEKVDSASDTTPAYTRPPQPGDIALCFYCGHVMAYLDAKGRFRPLTDQEMVEVAGDPDIVRALNLRLQR